MEFNFINFIFEYSILVTLVNALGKSYWIKYLKGFPIMFCNLRKIKRRSFKRWGDYGGSSVRYLSLFVMYLFETFFIKFYKTESFEIGTL